MYKAVYESTIASLAQPGDWLSGPERIDVWAETRRSANSELDRQRLEALTPAAVDGSHPATDHLTATENDAVHRIASDPGRLSRSWADGVMAETGEERYTEIVGVVAIASAVDWFARAMGWESAPMPVPGEGEPKRVRPADVGDVGAWVSQTIEKTRANVSRALSLVPQTNETWRQIVDAYYSRGDEFFELVWDRPLSRPQVELVAARTTVLNECFY